MKLSALIKLLNNIYTKYGDITVFIAPRTYIPKRIHRLLFTSKELYIANKKTDPELHIKLNLN